jgi:hypothetical protein
MKRLLYTIHVCYICFLLQCQLRATEGGVFLRVPSEEFTHSVHDILHIRNVGVGYKAVVIDSTVVLV